MANKTKAEKLVGGLYTTLLSTLELAPDEVGLLSSVTSGNPIILEGKRLALPTKDVLKMLADNDIIAFHPLSENIFEGISPVHQWLRNIIMERTSDIIMSTGYVLLKLAADKSLHEKLTENQLAKLSVLSGADEKLVESYRKLANSIDYSTPKRIINIKLAHGGELGDKRYARVAHASFPIAEQLEDGNKTIYDIDFRKKDIEILRNLFEIVVPGYREAGKYSHGSNSTVAPYFLVLLRVYVDLLEATGGTTYQFRSYIEDIIGRSLHVTPSDLLEVMADDNEEFAQMATAIRALPYNMGNNISQNPVEDKATTRRVNRDVRKDDEDDVVLDVLDNLSSKRERPRERAPTREVRERVNPNDLVGTLPRTNVTHRDEAVARRRSGHDDISRMVDDVLEPSRGRPRRRDDYDERRDSRRDRDYDDRRYNDRDRGRGRSRTAIGSLPRM